VIPPRILSHPLPLLIFDFSCSPFTGVGPVFFFTPPRGLDRPSKLRLPFLLSHGRYLSPLSPASSRKGVPNVFVFFHQPHHPFTTQADLARMLVSFHTRKSSSLSFPRPFRTHPPLEPCLSVFFSSRTLHVQKCSLEFPYSCGRPLLVFLYRTSIKPRGGPLLSRVGPASFRLGFY